MEQEWIKQTSGKKPVVEEKQEEVLVAKSPAVKRGSSFIASQQAKLTASIKKKQAMTPKRRPMPVS